MSCKSKYMDVHDQVQFGRLGMAKILLAKYTGNNKEYVFFCADPRVEAGDLVVARSKIGFEVVYVTKIIDETHHSARYANNWVIGRVEDMMEEFVKKHEKMSATMTIRKAMTDKIMKASLFPGAFFEDSMGLVGAGGFFRFNPETGKKSTITRDDIRRLREAMARFTPPVVFPSILAGLGSNRIIHDSIDFFPEDVENLTNATKAASMGNFTIYHEEDE